MEARYARTVRPRARRSTRGEDTPASRTARKTCNDYAAFEALIGLLFLQKENDRLIELFDLAEILSREEFKKNSSQGAEGEGSDDQMGEK